MQPKSVYLAGPFFSDGQNNRVKTVKNLLNKNQTINSDAIFLPGKDEYTDAAAGSFEWQIATFNADIRQIDQADVVVAILDYDLENGQHEADAGTIWECGYAYAQHKPVFLVRFDKQTENSINLMLAGSYTAMFNGEKDIANLATYDFYNLKNKYVHLDVI
ncbi:MULTISPECIES: nucleoside 2-deoxyribosyltransferase [Pediococcus]|jgi:nucleoside 2-deoxyribosyltransferase|uniref:nucleoside 2-deoxyribosyltransferase n=1 Tax=Pediococcus TaxID=1253 RepID=UPI00070F7890|nr:MULTISPECIES: nucleoside 2-deoxyribosyltransferase [Pediococcus]MCT3027908.1 nucleoside 2-deoxyribosyltransferase [Pediococcus parvulus]MCT3028856.1 nucleoside 2-deoxyribosyltransferase [Pediococcus parvulus]MCT3034308.1 nucleoside 2-deoxyribosyltransferase [Pediococcus parvulus]MDN5575747.1 nucleoside 2-deoxyribosyltransferase [Pediococcus sp.]GEL90234.1 nucleoside deoxyribosyltransferase [Pediococcus parvulus]